MFLDRFQSNFYQNMQNILQFIYNKAFWEISFHVINELFIFEPLVYIFMKKISSFLQKNETWEKWQFKIKDQDTSYTIKSTRGTVIIQSDISRSPSFWKSIYLSMEMSERNISLRGYLQMMYFLCVKFQDNLLNSLKGMGGSSGCSGPPPACRIPWTRIF